MSELSISKVHRNLDAKIKIGSLEAIDLIGVLIFGVIMNMIFGNTNLNVPMSIGLPGAFLTVLYFGKRNKPQDFLIHLIRFYIAPSQYQAGEVSKDEQSLRRTIYES